MEITINTDQPVTDAQRATATEMAQRVTRVWGETVTEIIIDAPGGLRHNNNRRIQITTTRANGNPRFTTAVVTPTGATRPTQSARIFRDTNGRIVRSR